MNRKSGLLALLVILLWWQLPSGMTQDADKNANNVESIEGWGEKDNIRAMPGISINFTKREFFTTGFIRVRQGPIELIACSPGSDKVHEVILQTNCSPTDFHLAMTLCKFKHGKPVGTGPNGSVLLPSGDRAVIFLEWDEMDGSVTRYRFEDLIVNVLNGQPMRRNGWVFTGSTFRMNPYTKKEVFLANEMKILIATYHNHTSILDNPSVTGTNDSLFQGNAQLLPPVNTKVRMIIVHPSKEDKEQWAAWEKAGDDETDMFADPATNGDPVTILKTWKGYQSDYDDSFFSLPIRSQKDLDTMWKRLHHKETPIPAMPVIDFETQMLCVLLGGQQHSSGYDIKAHGVVQAGDEYFVTFEDIVPGPDDVTADVLTSPWEMIMLPRIDGFVRYVPLKAAEPERHSIIESWEGENPDMEEGTRIIRNKNDWAELWGQVFSAMTVSPPAPDIDFNHHIVICVFAGRQKQAGATIHIDGLDKDDKALTVRYTIQYPEGDDVDIDYGPFHVLMTQKTNLPVKFKIEEK